MGSFEWTLSGFAAGGLACFISMPGPPPQKEGCDLYRVLQEEATAFVLRSPTCEPIQCAAKSEPPREEIKTPVAKTSESVEEDTVDEKPVRARRRHWRHRGRRYWR